MKKKNLFWGLLIILLALSSIASGLNILQDGPGVFRLALTALLFFLSISNISTLNFYGIFIPLAFALVLNQEFLNLHIESWPILFGSFLLSLGFSMIFSKRKLIHEKDSFTNNSQTMSGDNIKIEANFSNSSRYVQADNLRYTSVENNFGSLSVYFNEVSFNESGATIKVECNFGNLQLYLPKEIQTQNNIQASLGSVNEELKAAISGGPIVYLDGNVSFGKVEIFYV